MATLQLCPYRTDWRPGGTVSVLRHDITNNIDSEFTTNSYGSRLLLTPLFVGPDVTITSISNPLLATLTGQETAPPATRWHVKNCAPTVNKVAGSSEIPRLCQDLRRISGLTNEEIAQLLGVSRRSFQAWLAGGSISARKEARLRSVVRAVEQIHVKYFSQTRDRLFQRDKYSVSAFDLLSEGRVDAAVDLIMGSRKSSNSAPLPTTESLMVQLDRDQGSIPRSNVRLNRRLSKPIRRQ